MTGPFARAATQLDGTARDLDGLIQKLQTVAASYREAQARLGTIYRNTNAGKDLVSQAQKLGDQTVTVLAGTHQLIADIREAAGKARQGGTTS